MTTTDLTPVEYSAQRVLTTEQLAQFYECSTENIKKNFQNNKDRFIEGKHYFKLEGIELKQFKDRGNDFPLVGKNANVLYLWTKRGAARHAKMLSTEKAWQVFEVLEESYFDGQKVIAAPAVTDTRIKPADMIFEIGSTRDAIQKVFAVKDGIALAQATDMIGEFYGLDLSTLKKLIPPAGYEIGYLNATMIGAKLGGISNRDANKLLANKHLQVKNGKDWRLTEVGKQYAEEIPYTRNGHSGYQIKWTEQVIDLLRQPMLLEISEEQ